MNSNYIYTKRVMGLDVKVLCTMLVVLLLSAGLVGYSFTKRNKEIPCKSFDILIFGERNAGSKIYYSGQQLIFRVAAHIEDKVIWDFGDNSPKMEGAGTMHIFTSEKIFAVTATVNGKCPSTISVNIKQKETTVTDSAGNIVTPILGEPEAFENEPVTFTTPVAALSYRWSVDQPGYPVKNSQNAIFTFKKTGVYTVRLIVDDDRTKNYKFTINIKPIKKLVDNTEDEPIEIPKIEAKESPPIEAPPQSKPSEITEPIKPPGKTYVFTSDENLKDYLQSFLCGKMSLQALEPYFCDLNNTSVTVTEEKKITSATLANLCAALKCRRDIVILSINEVHRNTDKCVTSFLIHIEKTKQKRACPDN
ncbi:MAG TPA: hypothetical protein VFW07_04865 [Parafilimonas sp.]|nr:hypothetical protein [Parafilimonas sp.]